ncbi:MAG: hypothetical protein HY519_02720 [Candidatus Aenigmarchaeota archaeon]|nr:hypothetical protein [Candidatus Aenigmarchaeota archaeon]
MLSIQCDEHVKRSVIGGLHARGIATYGVEEAGLKGASDLALLDYCAGAG